MTIKVTPDQVDNAKLLVALDKARGRASEEWIVRLANAKQADSQTQIHRAAPSAHPSPRPATQS